MLRFALRACCVLALLLLTFDSALAQSGASTGLMGRVTDPSGAGIPGVSVTLTNVDTGSTRVVPTGSTGDWEARFIAPGTSAPPTSAGLRGRAAARA